MEHFPQEKETVFDILKSPAKEAYLLLNSKTPLELCNKYSNEDQKLMHSQSWDYNNGALITNQVKDILEAVSIQEYPEKERFWVQEILWFWYHHAISCAIWKYKDKEKAKIYAKKALEYQTEDHPNKITKLFSLLLEDKLEEARIWTDGIKNEPEKSTAAYLLAEWDSLSSST